MKNVKTKVIALLTAAIMVAGIPANQAAANSDQELFGTLIGAAVGGLVGAQFGRGDGKLATTAIGTLVGAGIGNSISRNGRYTVFAPRPLPRHRTVVVDPKPRVVYARYKVYPPKRNWDKKRHWNQKRSRGRWTPPGHRRTRWTPPRQRNRYYGPYHRRYRVVYR